MKYTPGPWKAIQRTWGYPRYDGGPVVKAWDVDSASGMPVAKGTIAVENEANARLIAKAPEMYALLRQLVGEAEYEGWTTTHREAETLLKEIDNE